ncbi:hypothetical protein RhiirA5_408547 [Rhizophagus irregularis]|uniref:Uncharacterized protein n=2 Tax=Rhizophagus irregularis TaxID=588596 RepID=A0A2I1EL14_9GLOM|nr:hypothetical protein RhiirA5_408547 [Rhizophagus irregularis]PKC61703.1 hypothetical protein RhiirA1_466149 [Rhizophagus irregularis]PKK66978.1 hypothetical protein RhiirC2_784112 [Rhizophagus irregularis]PKY22813.1 hypothetical protein RhiirB3_436849 [Rhizophagus irregularis]
MPRSKEVIEKYNQLNSEFSNRISVIGGKVDTSNKDKAKEKVVDSESEKLNGNKKVEDQFSQVKNYWLVFEYVSVRRKLIF